MSSQFVVMHIFTTKITPCEDFPKELNCISSTHVLTTNLAKMKPHSNTYKLHKCMYCKAAMALHIWFACITMAAHKEYNTKQARYLRRTGDDPTVWPVSLST